MSQAANWPISRKGEPGSSSCARRSRGSSLPRDDMALARFVGAAALDGRRLVGDVGDQRAHALGIGAEGVGGGGDLGLDGGH